ncbi:MAG: endolytic transglycosylase MltG, partial [Candidatus Omnitrophica bacterium]|nr:endolytic transglycosylase MltG [Candidatus Omnitrophota bacterium]
MKKISLFVIIVLFLLVVPPLLFFMGSKKFSEVKIIRIKPAISSKAIASLLKEEEIIKSKKIFLLILKLTRADRRLQAGLYELRSWSTPFAVIRKLVKGEVAIITLTIPEGLTSAKIANLLAEKKLCFSEEFLKIVKEKELEGFLFPARYTIPSQISVEGIIYMMQEKFKEVIAPYQKELEETSLKDIVILASIIEKEAQVNRERPIIASVLYNRLRKRLPLESCATVEYALGKHKARLSDEDLLFKSPYNTYLN